MSSQAKFSQAESRIVFGFSLRYTAGAYRRKSQHFKTSLPVIAVWLSVYFFILFYLFIYLFFEQPQILYFSINHPYLQSLLTLYLQPCFYPLNYVIPEKGLFLTHVYAGF